MEVHIRNPALRRLEQGDCEFEVSLDQLEVPGEPRYRVRFYLTESKGVGAYL